MVTGSLWHLSMRTTLHSWMATHNLIWSQLRSHPHFHSIMNCGIVDLNHDDVKKLISQDLVTGLKLDSKTAPDLICEPCLAGKMKANPFPPTGHIAAKPIAAKPLDLIHIDVHGPVPVQSHTGMKYYALFIDDNTKFKVSIPMKRKSETFSAYLKFEAYAENQLGDTIKAIQKDKGGEFMSREFEEHCDRKGIVRRHTVRKRPQQNGSAENGNKVMGECITTMLTEANLPMQFSVEALLALMHIWNGCPTSV